MADSCPNYHDAPSHKPLAYLPKFCLRAQFGDPSAGDRPKCESSEFRGTRAVAPKSDRQTVTLNQRQSSSKLHADIAHERNRSQHTF
jgi:hypothetical protein